MLTSDSLAEEQLQQELREMFLLDTEQQLQTYFEIIQQLNPRSWVADIQSIYRAIHTIKGGAVTVEANSMLYAAIILEQLLSDLRYLEVPPPLSDGDLSQVLVEAGELLASCLEATESGNKGIERSQSTLQRLETLHIRVKARYLPNWNEMKQVHQEFAEQGFDLVVLELEMAVNKLPQNGVVPTACVEVGVSLLTQLREIGEDLEFARGWRTLLDDHQAIIDRAESQEWRASLPRFLATLKRCAKNGGEVLEGDGERGRLGEGGTGGLGDGGTEVVASPWEIVSEASDDTLGEDFVDAPPERAFRQAIDDSLPTSSLEFDSSLEDLADWDISPELGLEIDVPNAADDDDTLGEDLVDAQPERAFRQGIDDALPTSSLEFDSSLEDLADWDMPLELGLEIDVPNAADDEDTLGEDFVDAPPERAFRQAIDDSLATSSLEFDSSLEDLADWDMSLELGMEIDVPDAADDEDTLGEDFVDASPERAFRQGIDDALPTSSLEFDSSLADLADWDNSLELGMEIDVLNLDPVDDNSWDFGGDFDAESMLAPDDNLLDELLAGDEWDLEDEPAQISVTQEQLLDELLVDADLKSGSLDLVQDISLQSAIGTKLTVEGTTESRGIGDFLDDFLCDFDLETYSSSQAPANNIPDLQPELAVLPIVALPNLSGSPVADIETKETIQSNTETRRNIQIPVPLARLDRSAQQVVDTLLTTRGINNQAQTLQIQLTQLTGLTAESARFATKLRQLQDDYSLLRNISDEQDGGNNLTLERYRQGYTTIERLLENILRMSELGQEIEISTHQTFDKLADLDRLILRVKDGIEVSRLVPFRNLTMRARAILRDLTNRYGKPVDLVVNNEQIELDAGVVQQLEPALLHLLRNAYDHGVEPVEDRLAVGKPATAKVTIALQRRGNIYRLTLQDDGGGIDRGKISSQAQARGFAHTSTSTNTDLLTVLCQPGFSSRDVVSEVSGRGVGMDVVAHQIAAIGGKLSLDTEMGKGSKFSIEVPAPQLLVSCVLLRVGDRTVALPTADILETVLLSTIESQLAIDRSHWQITTAAGVSPGFSLASYWQQFSSSLPEYAIGLRCRLEDNSAVWLIADDLLDRADLSINPLPSPLVPPAGLLGVSLQPDGRLISVLDPIALTDVLQSQSSTDTPTPKLAIDETTTTTILVVDDAALMRRRLSASLTTAGYVIHTCGDGLEALKWLQTNALPAMMITDMEMPNMDGLTLIDRCRQTGIDIPILVISSRLSEGWSNEAQRVGANNYLNKGFTTDKLLTTVRDLLTPALIPAI